MLLWWEMTHHYSGAREDYQTEGCEIWGPRISELWFEWCGISLFLAALALSRAYTM